MDFGLSEEQELLQRSAREGFVACVTHLTDVGGIGFGPDGSDIYDEGIRIPLCKLVDGGELNGLVLDVIKANNRMPTEAEGDIYAQIACLEVGAQLVSGSEAPIRAGNTLPIRNIPVGSTIHCIELQPGKGAQIARSAGTSATLLAREGTYAQVRMRSGEVRKIHIECRATIGEVANEEHSLRQLGKAGVKRHMGIRPTVRGVVMNPIDHPHGGGEGRTGEGRHPVDPWGNLTKGYRTRNNKRTQVFIVSRRKK